MTVLTPLDVLKKYYNFDSFREMQEDIITSVLNKKDTLALLPTSKGKALHKDTLICTPSGFKTMEEIQIGDYVLDKNKNPTKVVNKFQPLTLDHYEVFINYDITVLTCGDHLWKLSNNQIVDTKTLAKDFKENKELDLYFTLCNNYHEITYIHPIEDNKEDYFCITVDNEEKLYLITEHFIPTHNSICYQVPSLMLEGLTVVISPLISLQEDQVQRCKEKGIPAALLNSDLGIKERKKVETDILEDKIKLLYVSPETLFTPSCKELLKYKKISLIAVDEAHCFRGTDEVETSIGPLSFNTLYQLYTENNSIPFIKSYNEKTKSVELKKLVNVFQNPKNKLLKIDLGTKGAITCTHNHVLYTSHGERQAKDIKMGHKLKMLNTNKELEEVLVLSINSFPCSDKYLYDIEVEDNHNYFIKTKPRRNSVKFESVPVLVHNCTSVYGDFRPEYQKIHELRTIPAFKNASLLAVTATADEKIKQDIIKCTGLKKDFKEFRLSFDRPTINYHVLTKRDNGRKQILELIKLNGIESNGIIYCMTKKDTEDLSKYLSTLGYKTAAYHATVKNTKEITDEKGKKLSVKKYKKYILEKFLSGEIKIVCATIAFGMGVDHQHIKWVIHNDTPHNLDNYSQECLDEKTLIDTDKGLLSIKNVNINTDQVYTYNELKDIVELKPIKSKIINITDHWYYITLTNNKVLKVTGNHPIYLASGLQKKVEDLKVNDMVMYGLEIDTIRIKNIQKVILEKKEITYNLSIYDNNNFFAEGVLTHNCGRASRDESPASTYLLYDPHSYSKSAWLMRESTKNPDMLKIKLQKLQLIHHYATSENCRRQYLLGYFGESYPDYCGKCDNCGTNLLNRGY